MQGKEGMKKMKSERGWRLRACLWQALKN